jgi:hypothetical protein
VFTSEVLPRVRREVYPVLRYRLSLPRFATFTNLGSFGQSETVQVGPALDARFAFPLSAFGSSSDGFVTRGTAGYVWGFRDALVDVKGQASARLDGPAVIDQEAIFQLRGATPTFRWAFGRFVLRGLIDARRHDSQRTVVAVGGDDGLRGYAAQQFYAIGGSRWLGNFEYRTRPIEIRSVQLGLVAFYDAGSAYSRVSAMRLHHSLGAGLRVLFPQFNRYPFRVDVGLPLDSSGFAVLLSYSSEQMIALTQSEDDLRTTNLSLY